MSSPFVERDDGHGNKFVAADIGGLLLPPAPGIPDYSQHARDLKEMELNPGDVIITGFPKTGSHWMTSIVHMLMRGNADAYFDASQGSFLDRTPITAGTIAPADKPRIFFTHVKFQHLPQQVKEKNVKLVYLERNPKDTWVSFYNFVGGAAGYKSTWEHYFEAMMSSGLWYGNWFDFVLDWERDIEREKAAGLPIFVNHFEDLKKDPVGQIEKLGQFLGCKRGREVCEQIAKACNFSTMKAAQTSRGNEAVFYRKGEVGNWKNSFTVAQNERFDQKFKAKMQGSKLHYTFV